MESQWWYSGDKRLPPGKANCVADDKRTLSEKPMVSWRNPTIRDSRNKTILGGKVRGEIMVAKTQSRALLHLLQADRTIATPL
jgi:hypothetical protein